MRSRALKIHACGSASLIHHRMGALHHRLWLAGNWFRLVCTSPPEEQDRKVEDASRLEEIRRWLLRAIDSLGEESRGNSHFTRRAEETARRLDNPCR